MNKVYKTNGAVRIRLAPGLNGRIVSTLAINTQVASDDTTYVADNVRWKKVDAWIAEQFLSPVSAEVPPTAGNKLGLHVLPGVHENSLLGMMSRLSNAKKPIPAVLLAFVADGRRPISVSKIKSVSPSTKVFVRMLTGNDYQRNWDTASRYDGKRYFEAHKGLIDADMRMADYIQYYDLNEPAHGIGTNEWYEGVLDGADESNVKLAIYNFSVGNPGLPGEPRGDNWFWTHQSTHNLLRRVKRDGHAFCLHQYSLGGNWYNEYDMLRHRKIYPHLPADLRDIPLWLNEFGVTHITGQSYGDKGQFMARLKIAQAELSKSPSATAMLWTLGDSGGWSADQFDHMLDVYEQFALEAQ